MAEDGGVTAGGDVGRLTMGWTWCAGMVDAAGVDMAEGGGSAQESDQAVLRGDAAGKM